MKYPHVTPTQLSLLFNTTPTAILNAYVDPLNDVMTRYSINTHNRIAMFLAQTGHESGNYRSTKIVENLFYSARRIMQIWPNRFPTVESALPYAWDPSDPDREDVALANLVYGSRMGNEVNGTSDDDGWNFRGRGLIQLTGRSNYTNFARHVGLTLEKTITFVETPEGACEAAAWFWDVNKLNALADVADIRGCTRKINGGFIGLEERQKLYNNAIRILRS